MKKIPEKINAPFLSSGLIVVFFILHSVNENFGLISPKDALICSAWYFSLSIVITVASYLFFKRKYKASVYSIFLLIIFFFFGAFHDVLKKIPLPSVLTSYKILLSLLLIMIILITLIVKRSKKNLERMNLFFNTLFIILSIPELFLLPYYIFTHHEKTNDLGDYSKTLSGQYQRCDTCNKPDIYFIVFDGYASSKCLQEEFDFSNASLDSFLSGKKFFISYQSKSNYNITPLSLASTFNMNYLGKDLANGDLTSRLFEQGSITIFQNELTPILEKEGYTIKNYSGFELKSLSKQNFDLTKGKKLIHYQTLAGRIQRDIWWNFYLHNPLSNARSFKEKIRNTEVKEQIFQHFDELMKEINIQSGNPKFVYAHIMLPHEPYYFDEKGNYNSLSEYENVTSKPLYIGQLKYTNTFITQIVNKILEKKPSVIIIEGDHGFRYYTEISKKQKIFENLNTFYFPDHDYSSLYDGISPVNTFRAVLNKYFHEQFPLLKDTSIYIRDPEVPYEAKRKK